MGLSQPWAIQAMTVDGGAEIPGRPRRRADRPRARSRNPHAVRPAPRPRQSEAGQSEGTRVRACVCVYAHAWPSAHRTQDPTCIPQPRGAHAASPGMQSWCRGTSHSRGLSADIQSALASEGPGGLGQRPAALTCEPIAGDRCGEAGGRERAERRAGVVRGAWPREGRASRFLEGEPGWECRDSRGQRDRQTRRHPGPQSRFPRVPLSVGSLLTPRTEGRVYSVGSHR